jgi:uncharacterized membrane protein
VIPAVGSFVPAGAPLIRVEGAAPSLDRAAATDALSSGLERTLDEDVAYGFRMLVDMAERSLSESPFLDPTTAMQAIDRLHDGLRQLAVRVIPDGRCLDSSGQLRLTVPVMDWDSFVHLAFDEVRLVGADSPQVSRRLVAALHDLLEVAPPERRSVLEEQLQLLERTIRASGRDQRDRDMSLTPDMQGIGIAASNGTTASTADARSVNGARG